MIYRVKLKYIEEFQFVIKADSEKEAERIAVSMIDENSTSSNYYWYDSEIDKTDAAEEVDN